MYVSRMDHCSGFHRAEILQPALESTASILCIGLAALRQFLNTYSQIWPEVNKYKSDFSSGAEESTTLAVFTESDYRRRACMSKDTVKVRHPIPNLA